MWSLVFYCSIVSAALLLSVLGLWFTVAMPGIDRWSKHFFIFYFFALLVSCLTGLADLLTSYCFAPSPTAYFAMYLDSLFLSIPLPLLTVYLLHCCKENIRKSRSTFIVSGLWLVYFVLLTSALFIDGFFYITPDNQYDRGPLYPLLLMPIIAILLLTLIGAIRRRALLSRKTFLSFLVATVPTMIALFIHLFINVFAIIDISVVLSILSMYSFVLSDQIEQNLHHQREIALQQQEIARQQQEIAHERASVMVLQMRPHFIYNTLMSIYSLCNLDPQKARQVTMDFTNYLRKNFNAVASENAIPFSAELEHTRAYLAVEQVQYEDLLLVDYDTAATRFRVPPLTLQPIVENAVKHSLNPYEGPLHILIQTRSTDSSNEIIVEDNGVGFDPAAVSQPHTTLTNIRQRLEMMCQGKLEITAREGGGTRVLITIPKQNQEE